MVGRPARRSRVNAKDTVPLLSITGEKSGMTAPAAWARVYDKEKDGRAFYTSLGYVEHFENENFRKLLLGALGWVSNRPLQPRQDQRGVPTTGSPTTSSGDAGR